MNEKNRKFLTEILDITKIFFTALAIAITVNSCLIANASVPTGSMETTVMTGDRIIINRLSYKFDSPKRGDIVSFILPDDGTSQYLKRIIGLPGETLKGKDGVVYIDGAPLDPDYTDQVINEDFGPFTVPDGCYFMMGDNRNNSWDSRFWKNKYVSLMPLLERPNSVTFHIPASWSSMQMEKLYVSFINRVSKGQRQVSRLRRQFP